MHSSNVNYYRNLLLNHNGGDNVISKGTSIMSNVIRLPCAPSHRPTLERLGFYVRSGQNGHPALLDLLANGEDGVFGFVIDAQMSNGIEN